MTFPRWHLASLAALALAGCTDGGGPKDGSADATTYVPAYCANDPRAQPFAIGQTATSTSGIVVQLVAVSPDPSPPLRANYGLTVQLADAAGQPVTRTIRSVLPWMPDHGHGASVVPSPMEQGNGRWGIANVDLFMEGIWTVTVHLGDATTTDGGADDQAVFTFCIGGTES